MGATTPDEAARESLRVHLANSSSVDSTIRVRRTFVESPAAVVISEKPASLKARRLMTDYT